MTKILKITKENTASVVEEAVKTLASGGLVVFPTETLYGIGAMATNQSAIEKLLTYKARREGKPLSIAVDSLEMAEKYVEVNDTARNLYENFLPGPLTVVSKGKHTVANGVESETGTLGVRIPDYPLVLEIVKKLGAPITATSANASYQKRPYKVEDIFENISKKQKDLIDLVIDAGELPKREPSTVVDTTLNEKVVLRQGNVELTPIAEYVSGSPEETRKIGADLAKKYKHTIGYKSVILALEGELGAGKTEMTKGVAEELGIKETVDSPTFIIENEYDIARVENSYLSEKKPKLYHIDTWRMFDSDELLQLGFIEQVSLGNVFSIEWADKVKEIFEKVSEDAVIIWIKIEHSDDEHIRKITISDYHAK